MLKVIFDGGHRLHDPEFFLVRGKILKSTEQPERAERLLEGVSRCGFEVTAPEDFGEKPRHAIHTDRYLNFLENAHSQWRELGNSSGEVISNIHPLSQPANYPDGIVGRAGWHMADTACPLGEHTFAAACGSANSALTATQQVLDGDRFAYALCRPPGHHAYADIAGGFCFLNNVAIAAQHALESEKLKSHKRVAILDVDVHHGNGTQGIFYNRADVLTVSIHADPHHFYPFFWGHANETGLDEGQGYNINLPLAIGSGDDVFIAALQKAREQIEKFDPGILLIALGLDASESDPLRGLSVTTDGFGRIGDAIADFGLPTVFVQEGGYLSDVLGNNLAAVLNSVVNHS